MIWNPDPKRAAEIGDRFAAVCEERRVSTARLSRVEEWRNGSRPWDCRGSWAPVARGDIARCSHCPMWFTVGGLHYLPRHMSVLHGVRENLLTAIGLVHCAIVARSPLMEGLRELRAFVYPLENTTEIYYATKEDLEAAKALGRIIRDDRAVRRA